MSGRALRRGDVVEVAVEKGVYRGRGLGRLDGRVVLVARALPGERVRASVSAVHAGYAEADIAGGAAAFARPAGRPLPARGRVRRLLLPAARAGGAAGPEGGDPPRVARPGGRRVRGSGRRHCVARARLADPRLAPLRARRNGRAAARVPPRGHATRRRRSSRACSSRRRWRAPPARCATALRAGRASAARCAASSCSRLPTARRSWRRSTPRSTPRTWPALEPLGRATPGLTGFGVRAGDGRTRWLHGDPHVEATVLGQRLRAHAGAFFQGNRFLLEPLAREVVSLVPDGDAPALDLYAGVGLFALPLAARGLPAVTAVEGSAAAAEDARWNASRSGLAGRVRVVEDDVARALAAMPARAGEAVVLDPPRTGAGLEVVDAIVARAPSVVVYVSCDPPTLGRDLARFAALGYRPDDAAALRPVPRHVPHGDGRPPAAGVTLRQPS